MYSNVEETLTSNFNVNQKMIIVVTFECHFLCMYQHDSEKITAQIFAQYGPTAVTRHHNLDEKEQN